MFVFFLLFDFPNNNIFKKNKEISTNGNWKDFADKTWYDEIKEQFEISTPEQLAGLAEMVRTDKKSFINRKIILTKDIDLQLHEWTPIGYYSNLNNAQAFKGTFEGNGKTIFNLKINPNSNYQYIGLFCLIKEAKIQNLSIVNGYFNSQSTITDEDLFIGCFVAVMSESSVINCHSSCTILGGSTTIAGGITGKLNLGTITKCSNSGPIVGNRYAGGIVGGISGGSIYNSFNKGIIKSDNTAAGIIGSTITGDKINIINCYNIATILGETKSCGIIGYLGGRSKSQLHNIYNSGTLPDSGLVIATTESYSSYYSGSPFLTYIYWDIKNLNCKYSVSGETSDFAHNGIINGTKVTPFKSDSPIIKNHDNIIDALNAYVDDHPTEDLNHWTLGDTNEIAVLVFPITITFDPNGGECKTQSKTVNYKQKYGILPTATKENSKFLGWYKSLEDENSLIKEDDLVDSSINFKLYAHWVKQYIITFNANEGIVSTESKYVDENEKYGILPIPDRDNYFFIGWFTHLNGGEQITSETQVTSSIDQTLYAHWSPLHNVRFEGSGGIISFYSRKIAEGYPYAELPTAKREYYKFLGWFTEESGGHQIFETSIFESKTDQTIYAQWTPAYEIYFNGNGGEVSPQSKYVAKDGFYDDLPKPKREGYVFKGWYTENVDGTKISPSTKVDNEAEEQVLYAHWMPGQFTIFFNSNGGTAVMSLIAEYQSTISEPDKPTKKDYIFSGWCIDETLTQEYKFTTMPSENLRLHARWSQQYTVSFNANGGEINILSKSILTKMPYGDLPLATKIGHSFLGWFTKENGGQEITSTTRVNIDKDQILYAQWKINSYTISFESNGGDRVSPIIQQYNTAISLPMTLKKEDYTFFNWYEDKAFTVAFTYTEMPPKNYILYARWQKNKGMSSYDIANMILNFLSLGLSIISYIVSPIIAIRKLKRDERSNLRLNNIHNNHD